MDEKLLITVMKENPLENGEAVYTIDEVKLVTYYSDNKSTVVDEDGVVYRHICDKSNTARKITQKEYYNLTPLSKLAEKYPDTDEDSLVAIYREMYRTCIYYYGMLNETNPLVITMDTDTIKENFRAASEKRQPVEKTQEEEVAELIASIASGEYTKEELIDLKHNVGQNIANLTSILESVSYHLDEDYSEKAENTEEIDIEEVFKNVTKTLIDQDEPARRLIVEIARSLDEEPDGTAILVTGESGSGKTLLMSLIAKYLGRPFMIIDSTQLTGPAHTGRSIEQYLWELYEMCDRNLEEAEHAIIYFDEIDKKGSEKKSDIAGQGVLNQLLKFIDGATYIAAKNPQTVTENTSVPICTKNMLVISGGAFSEIYETKEKNPVGFGKEPQKSKEPEIKDFIEKAMISKEFMGRHPVIIHLNKLTTDSLKRILTSSDKSPIKDQEKKFAKKGVKFTVTPEYIDAVATRAIERKIGARGLNKIIKDTTWKPFDVVSCQRGEYEEVILDQDVLEDCEKFQLVKRRGIN